MNSGFCSTIFTLNKYPRWFWYPYYFETFFISLKSKIDKTASFSPVHVFNQENESEIKKKLFTILREYELCSSLKEGDNVSNVDAFSY